VRVMNNLPGRIIHWKIFSVLFHNEN
jgi:hypothetical protein